MMDLFLPIPMYILWILLIGLTAGWLAGQIMGSKYGTAGDITVGVGGSFIGGFLFPPFGILEYGTFGAIMMATVGAVLLLIMLRTVKYA